MFGINIFNTLIFLIIIAVSFDGFALLTGFAVFSMFTVILVPIALILLVFVIPFLNKTLKTHILPDLTSGEKIKKFFLTNPNPNCALF